MEHSAHINPDSVPSRWGIRFCIASIIVAGAGLMAILVAGPGHRLELIGTQIAIMIFGIGNVAMLIAIVSASVGLILNKGRPVNIWSRWSLGAIAVGVALLANSAMVVNSARSLPAIHDISTDTQQPPVFESVLPLRIDAPNPAEYAGAEVAAKQLAAYPDITTMTFSESADTVFQTATRVVENMGWDLVAADADAGRIEATDTTFWFGFKDDVVIRIRNRSGITELDIRSKSRVGMSDIGANANRIRSFRDRLNSSLSN